MPEPSAISRLLKRVTGRHRGDPADLQGYGGWAILSLDPLIVYTTSVAGFSLGAASALERYIANRRATFLIIPTWSLEVPEFREPLRAAAKAYRARNPSHRIIFLCNTQAELDGMKDSGDGARLLNHNLGVSEVDFQPLDDAVVEYDAFYNARLNPMKRHELTLFIDRCAFAYYRSPYETQSMERELIVRHRLVAPSHVFFNEVVDGVPVKLPPEEVNDIANRCAVGLCLSETEGAMFASMEYLMAGLPIVSTPGAGGRDFFFDPEYCLIVPPDARAVADGVAEMIARRIPREHIREKTLQRVDVQREEFLLLLNEELAAHGSPRRFGPVWLFRKSTLLSWGAWRHCLRQIGSRTVVEGGLGHRS